ncbi:hypothetical protein SODG_005138 [Sodalis praecaptivus]
MDETLLGPIREHVAREYPKEACGLIVQTATGARYLPCRNIHPSPTDHFTLSPDDYAQAEVQGDIVMIVHSHPDVVRLLPSALDRLQCDYSGVEWGIMSWPDGDFCTLSPRGERPLTGRAWVLGFDDCWTLIMDYYRQTYGIQLPNFSVEYEWWTQGQENRYDDNWQGAGFVEVAPETMRVGDIIMMQISAPVTNHAAVYLGDNLMLHHLFGKLSARTPYGRYYRDRTVRIVRHKERLYAENH